MTEEDHLRNKKEGARFLGVSVPTLERYMRDYGLPYVRLSAGVVRFRLCDLMEFAEQRLHRAVK
jgi:predicted site-specific integrase-resolvase